MSEKYIPRLQKLYKDELVASLMKELNITNVMQVPKLDKIVVNMGVGEAVNNPKLIDQAIKELSQITGQQPIARAAKKSEAGFKLREGQKIGAKVTLRKEKMYEFLDRLISITLPRVRDFEGVFLRIKFQRCCTVSVNISEYINLVDFGYISQSFDRKGNALSVWF